jgi:hypothetical protein
MVFNTKICSFLQSTYIFTLTLEMCLYKCLQIQKTPFIRQSTNHHQHEQENKTQQEFKIQTPSCVQWPIPMHNVL